MFTAMYLYHKNKITTSMFNCYLQLFAKHITDFLKDFYTYMYTYHKSFWRCINPCQIILKNRARTTSLS